jgi:hypothetical protein
VTKDNGIPRNLVFDSALTLFMTIYGTWRTRKGQDGYGPYAETLAYTDFNLFSGFHLRTVWARSVWLNTVQSLHEANLVTIGSIGASDGLPAIELSSYGCGISGNSFEEIVSFPQGFVTSDPR